MNTMCDISNCCIPANVREITLRGKSVACAEVIDVTTLWECLPSLQAVVHSSVALSEQGLLGCSRETSHNYAVGCIVSHAGVNQNLVPLQLIGGQHCRDTQGHHWTSVSFISQAYPKHSREERINRVTEITEMRVFQYAHLVFTRPL